MQFPEDEPINSIKAVVAATACSLDNVTSYGEDVGFNELDTFCEETLGAEVMGPFKDHLDRRTDRSEAAKGPLFRIQQARATIDRIEAEIAELAATGDGGDRVGRARQQKELKDGKVQAVMELMSQYKLLLAVLEDSLAGESPVRLRAMAAALRKAKDRCKAKAKEYRALRAKLNRSKTDLVKRHSDVTLLEEDAEAFDNDRKLQYGTKLHKDVATCQQMEDDLLQRMQELRQHNQMMQREMVENSVAERTSQARRTARTQTKQQVTGAPSTLDHHTTHGATRAGCDLWSCIH